MARAQKTYRFRLGDKFTLDYIYDIQGLGGGDWWEKVDDGSGDIDLSEECRCIRDTKITVIVETPNAGVTGAKPSTELEK